MNFKFKHFFGMGLGFVFGMGFFVNETFNSATNQDAALSLLMVFFCGVGLLLMTKAAKILFSRNYKRVTNETSSQE